MRLVSIMVLLLAVLAAPPARAQDRAPFAGQWRCQYSMEPFDRQPLDSHFWQFDLMLQANGGYQMHGSYYSPALGHPVPVHGQGTWGLTPDGQGGSTVSLQGQLLRQDAGWGPFAMTAAPADTGSLYRQVRGNTHQTNIICQR